MPQLLIDLLLLPALQQFLLEFSQVGLHRERGFGEVHGIFVIHEHIPFIRQQRLVVHFPLRNAPLYGVNAGNDDMLGSHAGYVVRQINGADDALKTAPALSGWYSP